MSKNPDFIIHIGFSKTGTTTLQKHLFGKHSQVKYLGKPYRDERFKNLLHHLMSEETLTYDPAPLEQYIAGNKLRTTRGTEKAVILSDEMFLSYSKVRDKGVVARRIKDIFSPCKILITIRNQYELLKSAYLSRGRLLLNVPGKFHGLGVGFQQWLDLTDDDFQKGYIAHADYFKTIDFYAKLFGKENVCILLLEEFIHNKEEYLKKLSGFAGIDFQESGERVGQAHEHKEIPQSQLDFELLRTRFFPFHKFPLVPAMLKFCIFIKKKLKKCKDPTAQVDIPGNWSERLAGLYREGNRKLVRDYGLPLEAYGYPL